ncbi:MAG: HAMP domain-containing protein [Acidobacteriota bacterium]|nr:MAG: HAMP domain-containing protein [Acidobacteriota bacterium]
MPFFRTFRGKLLLILALLLVATLGFQYYLNLVSQRESAELREAQTEALVAGITLGFTSIPMQDLRVQDLVDQADETYFSRETRQRIKDIIVIDHDWNVIDSLNAEFLPEYDENNNVVYKKARDLTGLPPLMESARLGDDAKNFPNPIDPDRKAISDEAHAIPIETSKGRWYVMVLIKNDRDEAARRAAQPLLFTLIVLLASSIITFMLVWRFSRPIANLSAAARRVAQGDLSTRVSEAERSDEMGMLARNFNEMAAELEKKRDLELQLQQAEKSAVVGRLGSAIAHEIRNPLNYINLTLDHLRTKYAPAEPVDKEKFEKLTSQLKTEVGRINQQISDFLNYSRPAKANLRPTDPRQVIDDSLRLIEPEAEEKGITIGIVEHENVPQIMADPEFLRSVFNNLFINALQSMETQGGHLGIKITPSETGNCVNFEISDTGVGIPPENLEKIFEPYFSTKETGTGLGLAIVQKIVESHNGTIDVRSEEAKGTTFTVKLPTHSEPQRRGDAEEKSR